ncbi:predicted protein, partial [Nematostella vectensis]
CPICSRPFKSPKILPCLHTYCSDCVKEIVRSRLGKLTLQCPKCPRSVDIPDPFTPDTLPFSLYHRRLLDLRLLENPQDSSASCGSCDSKSPLVCYCFHCGEFLCTDHEDQTLEFLCNDCNSCICQKCALTSHKGHFFTSMTEATEARRPELLERVKSLKLKFPVCERQVKRTSEAILLLEKQVNLVRQEIRAKTELIIETLKSHEQRMMAKLDNIHKESYRKYIAQKKLFEGQVTQLNECIDFSQSVLQRNLNSEILQTYPLLIRRCEELDRLVTESVTKSPESVTISFAVDHKLLEQIQNSRLGTIHVTATDINCCTVEGKGLQEGYPGHASQFTVATGSSTGRMCYAKGDCVTVRISDPKGKLLSNDIDDRRDGRYNVTFTPQSLGYHSVSVFVNNNPIKNSPFTVDVRERYQLKQVFSAVGGSPEQFQQPRAVAASLNGELAVADSGNHRIQLFDCQGKQLKYLRQFGSAGTHKGGMRWPSGVTFDSENNILISDTENNRIQIFSKHKDIVLAFGQTELENPQGICVNDKGHIAVCSGGQNPGVKIYSEDGKFLKHFNNPENGRFPAYLTYNSGRYFVSYSDGSVVKVFDTNGSFLYCIGMRDGDPHGDYRPRGLAIDMDNHLLVSDRTGLGIQIFTLDGRFI